LTDVDSGAGGVSVTIKEHGGHDATWVVFRGKNDAEVADLIGAATANGFYALVSEATTAFRNMTAANRSLGAQPANAPQQPQQGAGYGQPQQGGYAPQNGAQGYQQPQQGYAPQQPAQGGGGSNRLTPPPGVMAPACPHGTKTLLNGRYGPFWACPAPQSDPGKCKAEKYQGPPIL
jgi:hypothetical protein